MVSAHVNEVLISNNDSMYRLHKLEDVVNLTHHLLLTFLPQGDH